MLIESDDGLTNHLIVVEGAVSGDGAFKLDEVQQPQTADINQGSEKVASGTWEVEDMLRYDEQNNTYDLAYKLTAVDIDPDKTLVLEGEENAAQKQDFTALITGDGGLTLEAGAGAAGEGTTIALGDAQTEDKNAYKGATTVAAGTTVELVEDSAMGDTSSLLAQGNVILADGVEQEVHNIDSAGGGTITIGSGQNSGAVLTVQTDRGQSIGNKISGTGSLVVDMANAGNALVFTNNENDFSGTLTIRNGTFSLEPDAAGSTNAALVANAGLILGEGSRFDFGSNTHTLKSLTVNSEAVIESSALVIGASRAPHIINGTLALNAPAAVSLTDVSVARDLALADYDDDNGAGTDYKYQDFITTQGVEGSGSLTLTGSEGLADLSNLTLAYYQSGSDNPAAQTVWSINPVLGRNGNDFQAGALLREIQLIDNVVLAGAGSSTLSARVADSAIDGSHGLQFSLADEAASASFIVSNSGNSYSGVTTVDENVSVTLAARGGFGTTSELAVAGSVVLNQDVSQTVGALSGTGGIALNEGATLMLEQTGNAAIGNVLTGTGTLAVDLGDAGNELAFTNAQAPAFAGTVSLVNGFAELAAGSATQKVLSSTNLVLGSAAGLTVNGTPQAPNTLGSLVLGTDSHVDFSAIDVETASVGALLSVAGDVRVAGNASISVGGIDLSGTPDILAANSTGVTQVLIEGASVVVDSGAGLDLSTSLPVSEIRNGGEETAAAYGVWGGNGADGSAISIGGNTISAAIKLNEIQLAKDDGTGLVIDLDGVSNSTLGALLTDYGAVQGDITFTGSGSLVVANAQSSYSGETIVKDGAKITLGSDNALGRTSLLQVSGAGSQVNLNGAAQIAGRLDAAGDDALAGGGALTLSGTNAVSTIAGANAGFAADVALADQSGHRLEINDAASLGTSGTLTLGSGTVLQISGETQGTFSKQLAGTGEFAVSGSSFAVSPAAGTGNAGFSGRWSLASSDSGTGSAVSAAGDFSQGIESWFGSGEIAIDEGSTLALASTGGSAVAIENAVSGAGILSVTGTGSTQELNLSGTSNNPFAGMLEVADIGLTVGSDASGQINSNTTILAAADLLMNGSAALTVNGSATTFDNVVSAGSGNAINLGAMGFNAPGTPVPAETSRLDVTSLVVEGDALALNVSMPDSNNGDIAGSIAQGSLLDSGLAPFQTLIATDSSIGTETFGKLQLAGSESITSVTQGIFDGSNQVATGYYGYGLALSADGTDVGIAYDLTRVDIADGKELAISEDGELDAQITDETGTGSLLIASGAEVALSGSGSSYGGTTTVEGSLAAGAGALGETSRLVVSGSYVNAGDNSAGGLEVGSSGDLTINSGTTLSLAQEASEQSTIEGSMHGAGALALAAGTLQVTENADTDYAGGISLGGSSSDAVLNLQGAAAIGSGSVRFASEGSRLVINDSGSVVWNNALAGQGVIELAGTSVAEGEQLDFVFGSAQDDLGQDSRLVLNENTVFDLTAPAQGEAANHNGDAAGKLIVEVNNGATLANDGMSDKTIAGLALSGGTVDLGMLNESHGQISLNNGVLSIDAADPTRIDIASSNEVTTEGDRILTDSSVLLTGSSTGGVFDLDIFTDVSSIEGDGVLGEADEDGRQSIAGLATDSAFDSSTENLLQNADADGDNDLVARMTRADGGFLYDDAADAVKLSYSFREIELLWEEASQGLKIDAAGKSGGTLSARITGSGNLLLDGVMSINNSSADNANDYTGATYVLGNAEISALSDQSFGLTKELNVAEGGRVIFAENVDQSVGALTGTGAVALSSGAHLTVDNSLGADGGAGSLVIGADIAHASFETASGSASLTVDGARTSGGAAAENAQISFAGTNNLAGIVLTLENADFALDSAADNNYLTAASAQDFVLGTGAEVSVAALGTGATYGFNELSFAGGGLNVTGVVLTDRADASSAVISTDVLDLRNSGSLAVAADIDESFDILEDDGNTYASTLIKYGALAEGSDPSNLTAPADPITSPVLNGTTTVAHVGWTGEVTNTTNADGSGTIGMNYRVAGVALADAAGAGLVIDAGGKSDNVLEAVVTDYGQTAGNITFAGGEVRIGSSQNQDANTYTGKTFVTGGLVTLAKDAGFGRTSLLTIEGGAVDIGTHAQTVGGLAAAGSSVLQGSGTLTIDSAAGADSSSITGSNDFKGTVVLAGGHDLAMNDAAGLGADASIRFASNDSALNLNLTADGTFATDLSGSGTVAISTAAGSSTAIAGSNDGFAGSWVLSGSQTVNGTADLAADRILGNRASVNLQSGTLALSQAGEGLWTIDESFAGTGTLVLSGAANQEFAFGRDWSLASTFTGTVELTGGLKMTVGGSAGSYGAYNAADLAQADFKLGAGSTLVVGLQNLSVDTFDNLNVDGGSVQFAGRFGPGASSSELGELLVGSLTGAGNVVVDIPADTQTVSQTLEQNQVLSQDDAGHFEALIVAENGEVSAEGWTLNGSAETSASGLRQNIDSESGTVAQAIYDYELAAGEINQNNALGIAYNLTTVDIVNNKELELTTSGELSAALIDSVGAGNLKISGSGTSVTLSGSNAYSGSTTVEGAALTAQASGLGDTSALILTNGSYVNAGSNAVGQLTASKSSLTLNAGTELRIEGTSGSALTSGSIAGAGALLVEGGTLDVADVADESFKGAIELGTAQSAAELHLNDGTDGLGSGVVALANNQSRVVVADSRSGVGSDVELSNVIEGSGVIDVTLADENREFDFSSAQQLGFTGRLILNAGTYRLDEDGGVLAQAGLETGLGANVVVNSAGSTADRTLGALTLAGGTIDFGTLAVGSQTGQIVVAGGNDAFAAAGATTLKAALADEADAAGSSVFDSSKDISVVLIEGFDAQNEDWTKLALDAGSQNLTQVIRQSNRGAAGDAVATLSYSNGALKATAEGIAAGWELSQIELAAGNGSGLLVSTTDDQTISALITGSGAIEFAGGTVKLAHADNTYTGATSVTNGAALVLGADEALGDTARLNVVNGSVDFGTTTQTIGSITVDAQGSLTMAEGGALTLQNGASVISSANEASGSLVLANQGTTLELQNADAAGSLAVTAGAGTTVYLTQFGSQAAYGVVDNKLSGAGTYVVGNGTDAAWVKLANTDNDFARIEVSNLGHLAVDGMQAAAAALGNAALVVNAGGQADLSGTGAWTLANKLEVASGAELAATAGGSLNEFEFAGVDQKIDGTLALADALFNLGGGNAQVVSEGTLSAGGGADVHVNTGSAAQKLAGLVLAGGSLTFDGTLGVGDAQASTLGQLDVAGSAVLDAGTIHVTTSESGTSGAVNQANVLASEDEGRFQSLISAGNIDYTQGENGTIADVSLDIRDAAGAVVTAVTANVVDGSGAKLAIGTFSHRLKVEEGVGADRLGVSYGLTALDITGDLVLSETGTLDAAISSSSQEGSLAVASGSLVLAGANDYTVATIVADGARLAANAAGLGKTSALTINESGTYVNNGANVAGMLAAAGTFTLNDAFTIAGSAGSTSSISGTISGTGGLTVQGGTLNVATNASSGYSGDVVLGTNAQAAVLELAASADGGFGTGTIGFAHRDSRLSVAVNEDTMLANLVSGEGGIAVTGTNGENFAFRAGQNAQADAVFSGSLTLENVTYDFADDANDILGGVHLTTTGSTTLVVNTSADTATRSVGGMTLAGGTIDFGTVGSGAGVIDLGGHALSASGTTTLAVNASLAGLEDAQGSAALAGTIDETLALITNAAGATEQTLGNLALSAGEAGNAAFTRDLYQDGVKRAQIKGAFGGLVLEDAGTNLTNVAAQLQNSELELVDAAHGYEIASDGSLELKTTGSGNLIIGAEVVLANGSNDYTGDTAVSSTGVLTLKQSGALGQSSKHTDELRIAAGGKVDFGATSQIVGELDAQGDGALASSAGSTLALLKGGSISGANEGFAAAISLAGGDLTLENQNALGTSAVAAAGNTRVVLSGVSSDSGAADFANDLSGEGALVVENSSNVVLSGSNALTGGMTVSGSSTVSAAGDVKSHIGTGAIVLDENSKGVFTLTQASQQTGQSWTWSNAVSGLGALELARSAGATAAELLFADGALDGFRGTLAVDGWRLTLDAQQAGTAGATLHEIGASGLSSLVLGSGAEAQINGSVALAGKQVVLGSGGSLTFNGIGGPGSSTAGAHLAVQTLALNEGFIINLGVDDAAVQSGSLLTQDDGEGTTISLAAAQGGITGNLDGGRLSVNGESGEGTTIRFDVNQTGSGTPAESGKVAEAVYGYGFAVTGEAGSAQNLNISYSLEGVDIEQNKTLVLAGANDDSTAAANTLSVYLTGEGGLRAADGAVRLEETDRGSDYSGATTVSAGAALYAEAGTLGSENRHTAQLLVEGGASARIEGSNATGGLLVQKQGSANGILAIGSTDIAAPASDVVLTLVSSVDGKTYAGNRIDGLLLGNGTLAVLGNGQVDEGVEPDLTISGSQDGFYGNMTLGNGAWVHIDANSSNLFGNSTALNDVTVNAGSKLSIESDMRSDSSFLGVFRDGEEGGGTVEISLAEAGNHFRFAAAQTGEHFSGDFVLNRGTIDFDQLFATSDASDDDVLENATLVLNADGSLVLGTAADAAGSGVRRLGGLTLAGGTIDAGALGYQEHAGASATHIDLDGDGVLKLEAAESGADASRVVLGAADDAVGISGSGSEILAAGSTGASVVLVEGIGSLELVDGGQSQTLAADADIGSEYLTAELPTAGAAQQIEQSIVVDGAAQTALVAEAVRHFSNGFAYSHADKTLSAGYTVSHLGLLHETDAVASGSWTDDNLWQGLTVTAIAGADTTFTTAITDASAGARGNIVFKGAEGGSITLAGANTYHGKTWITDGARVAAGVDQAFGASQAMRVDAGSAVDFAGHDQTLGALFVAEGASLAGGSSADRSQLSVEGPAEIRSDNSALYADWTLGASDVTLTEEAALGHGTTTLTGTRLAIAGAGASGEFTSAIAGDRTSGITVSDHADVAFGTGALAGFEGAFAVAQNASARVNVEEDAVIENLLTVEETGTLALASASANGGEAAFGNAATSIKGSLKLENLTLDIAAEAEHFDNAALEAGSQAVVNVAAPVQEGVLGSLSMTDGSTLVFANGTPGAAGHGETAGIDLGAGALSLSGSVTVSLDINDYVTAEQVEDVQNRLVNAPLTAQDLAAADGGDILVNLISAATVSDVGAELTLAADGLNGNTLEIGIRNHADDAEDAATGTYGYRLSTGAGGLDLAYGLQKATIYDDKTLELAGSSLNRTADNRLDAVLSGTGGIEVASGLIELANSGSDYSGETTVNAAAVLVAGEAGHTLGNTSKLVLNGAQGQAAGARAEIYGAEAVGSLEVESGAQLLLSGAETTSASLAVSGADESVIRGAIAGSGALSVNGSSLTVETANAQYSGKVSVADSAVVVLKHFDSLGSAGSAGAIALNGEDAELEVNAQVDAMTSASRAVGTLSNAVTGNGVVTVNISSDEPQAQALLSFAQAQADVDSEEAFKGTINIEKGGFTLAYADATSTELTANQKAAWNSEIVVGQEGSLFVSQRDHEENRFVDKHVRALTLDGGRVYFAGLRYDIGSLQEQAGGQLELEGESGGMLSINSPSTVVLDAGSTNSLSASGSELLRADDGAQIDLVQNAADVLVDGQSAAAMTDEDAQRLNAWLTLSFADQNQKQTLTQGGREVAEVERSFGDGNGGSVFGVAASRQDASLYDLYLNYRISSINLIDAETGLVVTNVNSTPETLSATLTGEGAITFAGGEIHITGSEPNANTGRVVVAAGTAVAGKDNAFGSGSSLTVAPGAAADFGTSDQLLESLHSEGVLKGEAGSTITIRGESQFLAGAAAQNFHSNLVFETQATGVVEDVDALGDGNLSLGAGYTLAVNDVDGGVLDNSISGSGSLQIGGASAARPSAAIVLSGGNGNFSGGVTVSDGWSIQAQMGAGENQSDRIGTGVLTLAAESSSAAFAQTSGDLNWTGSVAGKGNLTLSADAGNRITIAQGALTDFNQGTVTVAGGIFELGSGNEAALGEADLAAEGENASVVVGSADQSGTIGTAGSVAVNDGASLVFEKPVSPGVDNDALLDVGGNLDLAGAGVTAVIAGELTPDGSHADSLSVQDVLSADRAGNLDMTLAQADAVTNYTGSLTLVDENGEELKLTSSGIGILDAAGVQIATGYYDYALNVSDDQTKLGISYQLTQVDVSAGKTLVLQGVASDYEGSEYANARTLSAAVTGEGGLQLAEGELTLASAENTYRGATVVGTGDNAATLTVAAGSSLGQTSSVTVNANAALVNESNATEAGALNVLSGGTISLAQGSTLAITGSGADASSIQGTLAGSGALVLSAGETLSVDADNAVGYSGRMTLGEGASAALVSDAAGGAPVRVNAQFASAANDAAVALSGDFELAADSADWHGAFELADGTSVRANSIAALGAADASITAGEGQAVVRLDYAGARTGTVSQSMDKSITFVKQGGGVVELASGALGAGAVNAAEGGLFFGSAGSSAQSAAHLTVAGGAWAAGQGTIAGLAVDRNGDFYVGGRAGYNLTTGGAGSVTVNGSVVNRGTIHVGAEPDNSAALAVGDIGNTLTINGDYAGEGGTLMLNTLIAAENSRTDSVVITGTLSGQGFIDVNLHEESTGGQLDYLKVASVGETASGAGLKLGSSLRVGGMYYALMVSDDGKEYYLMSSAIDPGTDPWQTDSVENPSGGMRSALAFIESQAFDLSLHGHLGETIYVDPLTGEQRESSFWMIQRGDWMKFSNASGQMGADGHLYTTHLGTDLFTRHVGMSTWHFGVLGSFADGSFDITSNRNGKSAEGELRGYSAGLYFAIESHAESGPFGSLQLRYNHFENTVSNEGSDEYTVNGFSLTAEAGWDQLLSRGWTEGGRKVEWRIEPHARLYWTGFDGGDDWTSAAGERYSTDADNGLLMRFGARTKVVSIGANGSAIQAYAEANWVHNGADYSTVVSTRYGDVTSTQSGSSFGEFRLGIEAQILPSVNFWLEGHHQSGEDDYRSTGAMVGMKYRW